MLTGLGIPFQDSLVSGLLISSKLSPILTVRIKLLTQGHRPIIQEKEFYRLEANVAFSQDVWS